MEYSINKLAKLAGVSTRTLRYYHQIGLLSPIRTSSNGYRIYEQHQVDLLQQILFYRELDVPLDEIRRIVLAKNFDGVAALENHLSALCEKQSRISLLIENVKLTLQAQKGEKTMSDSQKFEAFKKNLVAENEIKYGEEIREKYGDATVDKSNLRVMNMSENQYGEAEALSQELNSTLKAAFEVGDPMCELAQKACELHKNWLSYYWDSYSKEAHLGLTEMYVADPRFTEYYDKIAVGCAVFLRDAMKIYCK